MRAMILEQTVSLDRTETPLKLVNFPIPKPKSGEVLIKVSACGVCHTEIDEIEGRIPLPKLPIILGHEVVGIIDQVGLGSNKALIGNRVGVGWIYSSSGEKDENLSDKFHATGRDVHGGYAEYMIANENYIYPIPRSFSDVHAAPLLCAGAVGYRALKLARLQNKDFLGLTGFGGCAHIILQLAHFLYPQTKVFVFTRNLETQKFALSLGATWVGDITEVRAEKLHAIIDTTPAWKPLVYALKNLRPGGRLIINAIAKEELDKNSLLDLSYPEHLWMEKEIKSVANVTHWDLLEFLQIAEKIPIIPEVQTYPFVEANKAIVELKRGNVKGAKVLVFDDQNL